MLHKVRKPASDQPLGIIDVMLTQFGIACRKHSRKYPLDKMYIQMILYGLQVDGLHIIFMLGGFHDES